MTGPIDLIRVMLENDVIRTALIYYIVGIILWFAYILIANKLRISSNDRWRLTVNGKRCLPCFLTLIFVFIVLANALIYVGFLPYGPDTAGYTYAIKAVSKSGHWVAQGYDPYYTLYHTSACFLTMIKEILGSTQVAYISLLYAFLLSFLLIVGGLIPKTGLVEHMNSKCLSITIMTLLFIASPKLFGFDLLQQYVGLVYASISVVVLLAYSSNIETYLLFFLFVIISVISHLTSAFLLLIPLIASVFLRKRRFLLGSLTFIVIVVVYTLIFTPASIPHITTTASTPASIPHITTIYKFIEKLLNGTSLLSKSGFVIRALNEIPSAKIALFSWTLLPSIASAYVLLFLLFKIKNRKSKLFSDGKGRYNGFMFVSLITALGLIFLGLLTRAAGVEMLRYAVVPSYFILAILTSALMTRFLNEGKVAALGLIVFLLFLAPYLYSAMYSSERAPWAGEIRLAPVTYTDRVEMLPLVRYAEDGYHIYRWHDAYLPLEKVENPPHLLAGGSYYPIHDILKTVARDKVVKAPTNSLFVLYKENISSINFKKYNIILNEYQHLVVSSKS